MKVEIIIDGKLESVDVKNLDEICKNNKLSESDMIKYKHLFNKVTLYNHQAMSKDTLYQFGLSKMRVVKNVAHNCGVFRRTIKLYEDGIIEIGCFNGTYYECRDAITEVYTKRNMLCEMYDYLNKLLELIGGK